RSCGRAVPPFRLNLQRVSAGGKAGDDVLHDLVFRRVRIRVDGGLQDAINIDLGDAGPRIAKADPSRSGAGEGKCDGIHKSQISATGRMTRTRVHSPVTAELNRRVVLLDTSPRTAAGGIHIEGYSCGVAQAAARSRDRQSKGASLGR